MTKFEIGDLVRVRPLSTTPHVWHFVVGPIVTITSIPLYEYIVSLNGRKCLLAEDELEKI